MNTKHVVSLEIAKQLKKVGWKKETEICWSRFSISDDKYKYSLTNDIIPAEISELDYPAPLATEILEELPYKINQIDYLTLRKCYEKDFYVDYWDYEHERAISIKADTLPNALAKMWLYLNKRKERII